MTEDGKYRPAAAFVLTVWMIGGLLAIGNFIDALVQFAGSLT